MVTILPYVNVWWYNQTCSVQVMSPADLFVVRKSCCLHIRVAWPQECCHCWIYVASKSHKVCVLVPCISYISGHGQQITTSENLYCRSDVLCSWWLECCLVSHAIVITVERCHMHGSGAPWCRIGAHVVMVRCSVCVQIPETVTE